MSNAAMPDLGSGSVRKLLAQLAIPAVVAQIINMLYNIVDRIYIGHIPEVGSAALTGRSEERRVGKECRSRWSPYH